MKKMLKDRDFLKKLVLIALPIAAQNLITFAIQMADTVMLGALGQTQLTAASLANQPFFVFTILTFGLASGACVLNAQYWGKGDVGIIRRIQSITYKTLLVASVLCSCIALFLPGNLRE